MLRTMIRIRVLEEGIEKHFLAGEIPGYVTIALYLPQRDATLVIITNSSDDSLVPVRLATAVTSIVSPDHMYPAPA